MGEEDVVHSSFSCALSTDFPGNRLDKVLCYGLENSSVTRAFQGQILHAPASPLGVLEMEFLKADLAAEA